MSSILGGGSRPSQPMPKMPDPVRIPTADDPDVLLARKKKVQDAMTTREGSASTDLTQPYARTTLG